MTIGEETKKWYDENEPGGFAPALLRCFFFGLVVKRPDFVLLAEEVLTDGKAIIAIGPDCPKNCWFVWYFATRESFSPIDPMAEAPYPHLYVAYKRKGRIRIHHWEKLRKDFYAVADYVR